VRITDVLQHLTLKQRKADRKAARRQLDTGETVLDPELVGVLEQHRFLQRLQRLCSAYYIIFYYTFFLMLFIENGSLFCAGAGAAAIGEPAWADGLGD
jgi:hypothetical protein